MRRLRRTVFGLFAALIILLAVAMALGQLLVPLIARYPDRVAALLSERLHQPVSLAAVQGDWQASGPLLKVSELQIGSGDNPLRLPQAELKVDFGAWLKPDRRWLELRLRGASAYLSIDATGAWHLSGFQLSDSSADDGAELLGDLPVGLLFRDLDLQIQDERDHRNLRLRASALRVLTRGKRLHLGGLIRQPGGGAAIQLAARIDPVQRSGAAYVGGEDVDLAAWSEQFGLRDMQLQKGHGRLRVWLGWSRGRVDHLTTEYRLQGIELQRDGKTLLDFPQLDGLLQARGNPEQWHLRWQPDNKASGESAGLEIEQRAPHDLRIRAHNIDVSALSPWLALWPADREAGVPALLSLRPYGRFDALKLDWRNHRVLSLQAAFHGLGWESAAGLPGIKQLDGELRGDGESISLHVPAQGTTVRYPGVFRKPFVLSRIGGDVSFWQAADGWRIGTDDLDLQGEDFAVRLRGTLSTPAEAGLPILDVAARVTDARVPAAKLFWPIGELSPDTMAWLDRGLVSGTVNGRALFRGHLGDWPFEHQQGRFEAVADFQDAVLDYDADWPVAENLEGRAVFVNRGMHITTSAGSSLGNRADSASAEIPRFHQPRLNLTIRGRGRAERLLAWLRKTPIGDEHAAALAAIQFSGPARYNVKLELPLDDDEPNTAAKLDGRVQLADARFRVPDWSLDIENLDGPLHFDTGGIQGKDLNASYNGVPVLLAARIGDATNQSDAALEASMQGQFDAATLLKAYPTMAPIADFTQGSADFSIGLKMLADDQPDSSKQQLSIDSSLVGMALKLPAPLGKPEPTQKHLHVDLDVPTEGGRLSVRLGRTLDARLRLASASQPLAGDIALSGQAGPAPARGINVHGKADDLDISAWLQQILTVTLDSSGAPMPSPISVDIDSVHTHIADSDLGRLSLKLGQKNDDYEVSIAGESLSGKISIPGADIARRGITARLDRLHWPESKDTEQASDMASAVAPSAIPPLHLWVKDLRLGLAHLGELRFESVPVADGMQIEDFEMQSPDLQLSARGKWQGTAVDNHSRFSIDFSAKDLGQMLTVLGYPRLVAGGATLAHIDGRWPGSPWAFSLIDFDGRLKVHVADGRILEVEPGMGRLFGLLSIRELPRRLSLDFGDIFQAGYSFNTIDGDFRFDDGNAYTDDLKMQGPSADIEISGRTGVRQHDYDQQVRVTPHLGVALPVVGAIAGGPVGAAAGLAVQGLLGRGINRAGQAHYKVSGSWDKPDIERVARDRETAPVPAAPANVLPAPAQSSP